MIRLDNMLILGLIPLLSLAAPSSLFSASCNESSHFDCHDSSTPCIPLEWLCDNVHDCPNGLDESHCSYLHECPKNDLMCRNGECVDKHYRCDGTMDCSDGTDERGCEEMEEIMEKHRRGSAPTQSSSSLFGSSTSRPHAAPLVCSEKEFMCRLGQCIEIDAHCDGIWDCPHGDDEIGCNESLTTMELLSKAPTVKCNFGFQQCGDGKTCIPTIWACDGEEDCDDGSDEAHCEHLAEEELADIIRQHIEENDKSMKNGKDEKDELPSAHEFIHSSVEVLCDAGHFRCKGGKCINGTQACDGHSDCPLGDDESDRCHECRSPRDHKCTHICIDSPNGHKCSCPKGMYLGLDEATCEDTDECKHEGLRCSQYCENGHNGYECKCAAGYELAKDKHTCYLSGKDIDGTLYLSLAAEIRSTPLFSPQHSSNGYETVVATNHHGTTKNLAVLIKDNKLFTAMEPKSHEGVLAVVEDGAVKRLRENVTGINYIAVDWIGGNILYTVRHPSTLPGIYLCATSGLFCRRIINGKTNKRQNYRGLAVNPLRGLVAWIDVTEKDHKIMVANMDGSGIRVAVDSKLMYPSALSFDVIKNDLYFSDVDNKLIEKINLDSGHRTTVIYPVHHPYDIAFFNSFLYWTEWGTETLKVAAIGSQHSSPHLIHGFIQFPYGIAINHTRSQPSLSNNPCEGVSCPWMCVVVKADDFDSKDQLEARCVCPDEYEENNEYDSSIKGSLPCKLRKDLEDEERALMSHVSVEAMEDYCKTGSVCMNGGSCVEHANVHGRVDKITCKCASGYTGLWCEVTPLPDSDALNDDEDEMGDQEGQDSGVNGGTLVIILIIVFILAGILFWGSRNTDEITSMTRSTIHRVQEARLPERAADAIKTTTRNLARSSPLATTTFSTRPDPSTEASLLAAPTTTAPSVYPPLPNRASSNSLSAASNNFSNPAFDIHNSTAIPYSGFDEMNTSEPSYFMIERTEEEHNPFGRLN